MSAEPEVILLSIEIRARDAGYIEGILKQSDVCDESVLERFTDAVTAAIESPS